MSPLLSVTTVSEKASIGRSKTFASMKTWKASRYVDGVMDACATICFRSSKPCGAKEQAQVLMRQVFARDKDAFYRGTRLLGLIGKRLS